jgi:hypothetical protein
MPRIDKAWGFPPGTSGEMSMMIRIVMLWVLGLLTIVPYGIYQLLFTAQRDEYALLITLVLFWIFGFWGVVAPLVAATRVRRLMRALETAQSRDKLLELFQSNESEAVAIDLIASENGLPRFLAKKIYRLGLKKFQQSEDSPA